MKTLLALALVSLSNFAFSVETRSSYTEPAQSIQISYELGNETEDEVVILNPAATLGSTTYRFLGERAIGYTLCKALGFKREKEVRYEKLAVYMEEDFLVIDLQGKISRTFGLESLQSVVCEKMKK